MRSPFQPELAERGPTLPKDPGCRTGLCPTMTTLDVYADPLNNRSGLLKYRSGLHLETGQRSKR